MKRVWASLAGLALLGACGETAQRPPVVVPPEPVLTELAGDHPCVLAGARSRDAGKVFDEGIAAMRAHDEAADWNDDACAKTSAIFLCAESTLRATTSRRWAEALHDAGLARQRCDHHPAAAELFRAALEVEPKHWHARAELALYELESKHDLDKAIARLEQAVTDAKFQAPDALVYLARVQTVRDGQGTRSALCKTTRDGTELALADFDCALLNLKRAMALAPTRANVHAEMARHYLLRARRAGGAAAALDLAFGFASEGLARHPKHAPLHETLGAIELERGNALAARKSYETATLLAPRFFEAHEGLAALLLGAREHAAAESTYRAALTLRPNAYDAHLGLARALRGQITAENAKAQIVKVRIELDACMKLDAERPDAYFDEGTLLWDDSRDAARASFTTFLAKAGAKPVYAAAVSRAKARLATP
jgi:tetratricopeptide (TPR) repeat protein